MENQLDAHNPFPKGSSEYIMNNAIIGNDILEFNGILGVVSKESEFKKQIKDLQNENQQSKQTNQQLQKTNEQLLAENLKLKNDVDYYKNRKNYYKNKFESQCDETDYAKNKSQIIDGDWHIKYDKLYQKYQKLKNKFESIKNIING